MAQQHKDNILKSKHYALVNPVNTKGVMGAGLAKQFKNTFPTMFENYREACATGTFNTGSIHTFEENGHVIINLPTKDDWRDPSKIEYIESGMDTLVEYVIENDIRSIAIPPLGSGLGGLDPDEVFPIMYEKMEQMARLGVEVDFYHPENGVEKIAQRSHHIMTVGHRPDVLVGGYNYLSTPEAQQLHSDYVSVIEERIKEHGHVTVHTGMNQGVDMIAAYATLSAREKYPDNVSLHCEIPYEDQAEAWPQTIRQRYEAVRSQADSESVYGESYSNYLTSVRNRHMVNIADECMIVYSGMDRTGEPRQAVDMITESKKNLMYLGGYVVADKIVSTEVINNTYSPDIHSREMLSKLNIVKEPSIKDQLDVKKMFRKSVRKHRMINEENKVDTSLTIDV